MNRIKKVFEDLKSKKQTAFVSFITAGDYNYETSSQIFQNLPKNGVDLIELGIPFLDPAGDGPIIEAASKRSIQAGMSLKKTLSMVENFRKNNQKTPIILMGYYNPILAYGLEKFTIAAKKTGVDGILIVDLPFEEDHELKKFTKKNGIDLIKMITPATDDKRIKKIIANAEGFIYLVSILGITGTSSSNKENNAKQIKKIKKLTNLPIVVGFGIKDPNQANTMSKIGADGLVIGSSLVNVIAEGLEKKSNQSEIIKSFLDKVKSFSKAIKQDLDQEKDD